MRTDQDWNEEHVDETNLYSTFVDGTEEQWFTLGIEVEELALEVLSDGQEAQLVLTVGSVGWRHLLDLHLQSPGCGQWVDNGKQGTGLRVKGGCLMTFNGKR